MAVYFYDKPSKLHGEIMRLIKKDERPLVILAGDLKLPAVWLKRFAAGEVANPGVNRMEYIYEQLSNVSLLPE